MKAKMTKNSPNLNQRNLTEELFNNLIRPLYNNIDLKLGRPHSPQSKKIDEYNGIVATIYSQYCYESWINGQAATKFSDRQQTISDLLTECELSPTLIALSKVMLPQVGQRRRARGAISATYRPRGTAARGEEKQGYHGYARRAEQARSMGKAKRAAQLKGSRLRRAVIASQPFSVASRNQWSTLHADDRAYFTGGKKKTRKKRRRRRRKTRRRRKKHKRKTRRKR